MKIKKNISSSVTAAALYLGIFIVSLATPTDPDLGWHLKYGEFFLKYGKILRDNTFSQLMPNYHWTNNSWGIDPLTYQTFHHFGFLGLSILGAVVITFTLFFIGKAVRLSLFEKSIIFPIILFLTSSVNQVSFRGQLVTLLFISIMFFILSKYESNRKSALLLLPLFVIWSNLHGEFILGFAIFYIWFFVYILKEIYLNHGKEIKKFLFYEKFLIISVLGSLLCPIISPFGIGVYIEVLGFFNNPLERFITEFQPIADFSTVWWHLLITGVLISLGLILLGIGRKTLDKAPFYIPSFILFVLALWIRRYAWPFYYSSIFLLQPVVNFLQPESKKYATYVASIIAVVFLITTLGLKYPFKNISSMTWDSYCKEIVYCSPRAAKLIIKNKLNNGKLLTIYDYGGWLIWNYPQIKTTVDGRMNLWTDNKGFSAFGYYYPIEQNKADINSTPYTAVLTSHTKPIYGELLDLSKQGKWKILYNDDLSAVFVKN